MHTPKYAVTLEIILRIYDGISKNTIACIDISSSSRKKLMGFVKKISIYVNMFITCMR